MADTVKIQMDLPQQLSIEIDRALLNIREREGKRMTKADWIIESIKLKLKDVKK